MCGEASSSNYLYDGDDLLEDVDATGNELARYAQGGIDEPFAETRSSTTAFYEQDGLGSVTSLSSLTGTLSNTYTYDAFGNLVASTGSLANSFQYTGRDFDQETGLHYYRARYYDSTVGRFLSEDPISFAGGTDFYAYAQNSVTNLIDSSGLLGNHKGFDKPWNEARMLLSNPDCAAFLKKILINIHLAPDLDLFLNTFDQVNFLPTPKGDPLYKQGYTAHVDQIGQSSDVHIDRPWRSNVPETMLHEVLHTIYYDKTDYQLAKATDPNYNGANDDTDASINQASDFFSKEINKHCHSDNCKNKKPK